MKYILELFKPCSYTGKSLQHYAKLSRNSLLQTKACTTQGMSQYCGRRAITVHSPQSIRWCGVSAGRWFGISTDRWCRVSTVRQFSISSSLACRQHTPGDRSQERDIRSTLYYVIALGVLVVGMSYAAVPLYRIFCQAYSFGGAVRKSEDGEKVAAMAARQNRRINILFTADTAASMTWNFRPQQMKIELAVGETALAFYTAKNPTDRSVVGVSTYNVVPFEAGQYFNKIQCFCFEEQMLNPREEVQMPVFFYIDPEFDDDPAMDKVTDITLSYTFFEAKPGMEIPLPGFMNR